MGNKYSYEPKAPNAAGHRKHKWDGAVAGFQKNAAGELEGKCPSTSL
ncbi:hypothetical protein CCP2SC5_90019 [Azospirillaceae bacterium]